MNKQQLSARLYSLTTDDNLAAGLSAIYHSDATWRGFHPINELQGLDAIAGNFWQPLRSSFPDLERRDSMIIGGQYQSQQFVATLGHYCGSFQQPWLGISANKRSCMLRYGEVHRIKDGKIDQSTVLIDLLDLMRQVGVWPLAPSLGMEMQWPSPIVPENLTTNNADNPESSLELVLKMHRAINEYDDTHANSVDDFMNMEQKHYWHPQMMWYGPAGIGSTRGLSGFVEQHQRPFRLAFPNRKAVGHYVRLSDGAYAMTSGWPSLEGQHQGANWLGLPASNKTVRMRVMDFYLIHEGLIRENWIPIDIIDILRQMGVDIFARLKDMGKV